MSNNHDATAEVNFKYTTEPNTVKCILCGDDIKSDLPVKPICHGCIDEIIVRSEDIRPIILVSK